LSLKLSIITVTKNNKPGLLRAIDCVRNQTYRNVEHIIVDGGSTDGTKEMMEDGKWMMDNVKFFTEPDEGIYDAINKGIKLATGDVIGLLHSDDLYADENVLTEYANAFSKTNVDAVYSDLVYFSQKSGVRSQESEGGNSTTTNYSVIRYWKTHKSVKSNQSLVNRKDTDHHLLVTDHLLKNGWMPPHPTLFIRKEIFDKYGFYNTYLKIASDYDMILRLLFKHKITSYYLPITTYLMSIGGASNKSIKNIIQKSKEDYLAMKMNGIKYPVITLFSKNFRKLPQFLARDL